jgi:RNA polymerase sigma-70 factor (ECF subfamily)
MSPSFEDVYANEMDHLRSILGRLGVRPAWVEDAAHETLLIAWSKWGTYDGARALRPWLTGIAWRVASDLRMRAFVRREQLGVEPGGACEQPDPEQTIIAAEALKQLRDAVAAMPEERRAVLVLHELQEVKIPRVAQALDVPLNTAYSRLRLARRDLAERLGAQV